MLKKIIYYIKRDMENEVKKVRPAYIVTSIRIQKDTYEEAKATLTEEQVSFSRFLELMLREFNFKRKMNKLHKTNMETNN